MTADSQAARVHFDRGESLALIGRWEAAAAEYERALAALPAYAEAQNRLGVALRRIGEPEEALAHFESAARLKPDLIEAHENRASVLRNLNRDEEALEAVDLALRLDPEHCAALNTRGNILRALGKAENALECYERAVRSCPDSGPSRFNRGACLLSLGRFARGWADYEFRWRSADLDRMGAINHRPLWRGEDLAGKTILLHAEQGYGDTIQFCRYVRLIADRGAEVILAGPPQLRGLMAHLRGLSTYTSRVDFGRRFDFHCPLLSLPMMLGTDLMTIPSHSRYLAAPASFREKWRDRLGPRRAPRIGIAWAGNPNHANDRQRSITLDMARGLLPDRAEPYCLQYLIPPRDVPEMALFPRLRYFGEDIADFCDTAALILEMDLIISVDTAVLHLAAALGAPVWGLITVAADWRWLLDRSDSPWYPSLRLFRQSAQEGWNPVISAVRNEAERCFELQPAIRANSSKVL